MIQGELFAKVAFAYAEAENGRLNNSALYQRVGDPDALKRKDPVGKDGQLHSLEARKIRWVQQTMKRLGLLQRVSPGVWGLSHQIKEQLHQATADVKMVAFSTTLGVAIWARSESVLPGLAPETVHLCITSPPYPLRYARAYGNPTEADFHDFICRSLEPVVKALVPGGSVVLNISNDIFMPGSPARSLYVERMVLALHDRLGLHLMDRIPWVNFSKPPGPTHWACAIQGGRKQLCVAWEPIFWFTNDPMKVRSDNRRVLEEHTARHLKLIASGGAGRDAQYGDGAYVLRPGSFGNETAGRIPKNVLMKGHVCPDTMEYRRFANGSELRTHGAMFPTSIPDFFIRLLTEPGELVIDLFGGTGKSGLAAERLGRRWIVFEMIYEYLAGGSSAFKNFPGFEFAGMRPVSG